DERAEHAAVEHLERRVHAGLDARLRDEQRHQEGQRRDEKAVVVADDERRGVPLPVYAFVAITIRITSTSAASVISAGASFTRSRKCDVRCAAACEKT